MDSGYIQVDYDGILRRRDEATEGIATSYLYSELIELNSTLLEIKSLINDSEFGLTRITYKDREGDLSELENNLYTIISFPESFKAEFSEMDTDFHIEFNEAVNLLSEVSMEDIRLDLGKTDLVLVLNDGHENTATGEQTYITSKMQIGDGWLQDGIKITDFLGYDGQNKGIAYTRYVEGFTEMLYIPELAEDENANTYLSEYLAENADVIRDFTHRADFENTKIQPLRDVVAETLEAVSLGILPIIEGELRYDIIRGEKISSREAIWYEIEGSIDVGSAFLAAAGGAKLTKIVGEELLQAVAGEGTAYVAYECGASDTQSAVLNMTARIATGAFIHNVGNTTKVTADYMEAADDLDFRVKDKNLRGLKYINVKPDYAVEVKRFNNELEALVKKGEIKTISFSDSRVKKIFEKTSYRSISTNMPDVSTYDVIKQAVEKEGISYDEFIKLSRKTTDQLTDEQLKMIERVTSNVKMPTNDTLMSKVLSKDNVIFDLKNADPKTKTVGKCVTTANDVNDCVTYNDYYNMLGLNYDSSPFKDGSLMFPMRFTTDKTNAVVRSFGGTTDANADRVINLLGINKNKKIVNPWPYTGTASTLNVSGGRGAFELNFADIFPEVNDGAAIYRVSKSCNVEKLFAVKIDKEWFLVN